MAAPMYFQWQNPVLLKTIYPRRNRKLADFLIYCREIELWEEYKDKDIKDLDEEVKAYVAERDRAVVTAYKTYRTEYDYFTIGDIRTPYLGKYKLKDEKELAPIHELHRAFKDNLPKRQDVRKEKNFVAYYASAWQEKVRATPRHPGLTAIPDSCWMWRRGGALDRIRERHGAGKGGR